PFPVLRSKSVKAFVLTVDVEPDGRDPDSAPAADWQGFPDCVALLERLRSRLRQRTGMPVHFSWFLRMDPEVEARSGSAGYLAEAYADLLRALVAQGDELGLHVHAFRRDVAGAWYADHGDAEWIRRSVRAALRAFAGATGRPARSFR